MYTLARAALSLYNINVNATFFCCQAVEVPGIKIFNFSASLSYANAEYFVRRLYERVRCNPEKIKREREQRKRNLEKEMKKRKRQKSKSSVSPNRSSHLDLEVLNVCFTASYFGYYAYAIR
jgi:hypothetical protein